MNRKSLVKLLAEFNSPNWCTRQIDGTDEKIDWLPIWEFEGLRFGVTKNGGWTGEFADKKRIRPDTFYAAFLTILEKERSDIVKSLKEAITSAGLPENVIRTFPFDEIIETAITIPSYIMCTYSWLDDGYPLSPGIVNLLPDHKLVRRWQKERMDKIINV
ncbi:MAG: hypothetical protein PVH36_05185 [Desulfobacterales bacterium]|jgi:hypothetical protein